MKVIKQCVGTDISKDSFHACFCKLNEDLTVLFSSIKIFENNEKGFKAFLKWSKQESVANLSFSVLMEPTGVYYENLAYFLHKKGTKQHVVLPNMTKNYMRSLNIKSKTDSIDAKYLAQMGVERSLPYWQPPASFFKRLRSLTRHYQQLQNNMTFHKNQIHSASLTKDIDRFVLKSKNRMLSILNEEIDACLKAINDLIASDDLYSDKFKKLLSISGVGIKTAAVVVAETQGFYLIRNRKQLVSFAGYDIVKNESGTSIKGVERISKKGNKFIRNALHFPALTAVKHSNNFENFFHRILGKRHIKMVSYVAVQRKLLLLMYALWTKNEMYDENYISKQSKIEVA